MYMHGSRNSRQGGPGQSDKKSSDNVFFFCFFLSSAYFTEVKWSISKKSIIYKVPEGVQHFPGGGGGGSNSLFPIETHITCDFPWGSGPPVRPSGSALDVETESRNFSDLEVQRVYRWQ